MPPKCNEVQQSATLTCTITNKRTEMKYLRSPLPIIHPCSRCNALMNRGDEKCTCVDMEHEEQVACGASNSALHRMVRQSQFSNYQCKYSQHTALKSQQVPGQHGQRKHAGGSHEDCKTIHFLRST